MDVRMISAEAGKAKHFEVWNGRDRVASVHTKKPMTRDELAALFRPPPDIAAEDTSRAAQ